MDTKKKLHLSSETLRNLGARTAIKTGFVARGTLDGCVVPPPRHSVQLPQPCASGPVLPQ